MCSIMYLTHKNYNWNFTPANTWTKITKTIPSASGVTINNDNASWYEYSNSCILW